MEGAGGRKMKREGAVSTFLKTDDSLEDSRCLKTETSRKISANE